MQPFTKRLYRRKLEHITNTYISSGVIDIPGFKLHPLKGSDKGRWSIWVSGNWRITFEFLNGHAFVLNYEDYH